MTPLVKVKKDDQALQFTKSNKRASAKGTCEKKKDDRDFVDTKTYSQVFTWGYDYSLQPSAS